MFCILKTIFNHMLVFHSFLSADALVKVAHFTHVQALADFDLQDPVILGLPNLGWSLMLLV